MFEIGTIECADINQVFIDGVELQYVVAFDPDNGWADIYLDGAPGQLMRVYGVITYNRHSDQQ